jgi:glycerate-2-kinase
MPRKLDPAEMARRKAAELGFTPHLLTTNFHLEAREAGRAIAHIAVNMTRNGEPFEAPCALLTRGEMLVTVGNETGVGGRNQEFCLSAAGVIAGNDRIVIGSVDTDGTDGPGNQFSGGGETIPCLAGGMVDGTTLARVKAAGLDFDAELRRHNTTLPLWKSDSGVLATHNISINDLGVTLILGKD